MGDSLAVKIIREHLVDGQMVAGQPIALRIDQTLIQDATGTLVDLELESLNIDRVRTELSVTYVDHNIIQTDSRSMDDHRYLQSVAARYGMVFSPPGNGISHPVHMERFGVPGKTLLGSDSHTTMGGAIGMLAIGAGGLDVCMAMAGKAFHLVMPRIWGIRVSGKLPPWVSGKDVVLELLRRYSCNGGLGKIMEFFGPDVENLDEAARATICNMGVDMGATAAIFPSDSVTRAFLRRTGREHHWRPLAPDPDARYDELTELDLSSLEPLVAAPYNPDNVKTMTEVRGTKVGQVIIGSSPNCNYRDYAIAALILKGRRVHPSLSFEINPGSRQVLENLLINGALLSLIESGARIHQPGCLGCVGMGQVPATGIISLRTMPRNFRGRSGTKDDQVYLCSPEVAAASALTGEITDPRTLGPCPPFTYPDRYVFRTDWFIEPPPDGSNVEIIRGPNIKPLPQFPELEDTLEVEVLLKVGDNISTDIIMPAGNRTLPLRSNIPGIAEYVFEVEDATFPRRAKEARSSAIIGGGNYGQGSSREHAALAPRYLGVRVKIVRSFARIHKANLINFGILPLTFAVPADYDAIRQGDRLRLENVRDLIARGERIIPVRIGERTILTHLDVPPRAREILFAGGLLNWARKR